VNARLPSVAVVIPTYNRSDLLARMLRAVAAVDYPSMSVVVVDDGSAEAHREGIRAAADAAGATLLTQANAGPAAARNNGVAHTQSDLVAFLDDDCSPRPDWLRRLVAAFDGAGEGKGGLGGVGGRVVSAPPRGFVGRFCSAAKYSTGTPEHFTNAATANACYRRAVLEEVGGFDPSFKHPGGDDPDLSRRVVAAGYELRPVPEAIVEHAEIERLGELVRHLFWRGLGEARGKRKEGRASWVALRAVLFPLYCARRTAQTWRVSEGHGGAPVRASYAGLEGLISLAFIAGSVVGLVRRE
jgi:GT2 family glycosyltransferase